MKLQTFLYMRVPGSRAFMAAADSQPTFSQSLHVRHIDGIHVHTFSAHQPNAQVHRCPSLTFHIFDFSSETA